MTEERGYCVYIHKNRTNGKVYVGCTKKSLNARSDNGNGYKKCTRFWQDIVKYGFDGFDHMVLKTGMSREEALQLEETLVDSLQAMNPEYGYNMRRGGIHNVPCAEVGQAISAAKQGHPVSEETRRKLREYNNRPVEQLSMDGKTLARFNSLTEAAAAVGTRKTNICAVCRGKKPTSRGFRWRYAG